jgi:hypothetical protein
MNKETNCLVLGDGSQKGDHAHVTKSTPLDLKRREFQESEQYRTELAPDINQTREKEYTFCAALTVQRWVEARLWERWNRRNGSVVIRK